MTIFKNGKVIIFFLITALLLLSPIIFYGSVLFFYRNKIIPRVLITSIDISGLKKYQAIELLSKNINLPTSISLNINGENFEIPLSEIGFRYDFEKTYSEAFSAFRNENYYSTAFEILHSLYSPKLQSLHFDYNESLLDEYLSVISAKMSIDPVYPSAVLNSGKVEITKGSIGRELNISNLKREIVDMFKNNKFDTVVASAEKIDPTLNSEEELIFLSRAQQMLDKTLELKLDNYSKKLEGENILVFLSPLGGYSSIETDKLVDILKADLENEPQNSVFTFKDGKVIEFVPSKEGIKIKNDSLREYFYQALGSLEKGEKTQVFDIPVSKIAAEITNNEVNDLGINELVGSGVSYYKGSIPGRIHNIGLASSRINGVLIKPGETFSFNSAVGNVSALTGYKQAYIIQDGKTILGDGGGVCQVSTTLFRAVLNAGLQIVERSPHSYRVSYYEQNSPPGLDATVFSPTTDFKFKNDTPATILIQTTYEPKFYKLTIDLFGTSDGRVAHVTKPVVVSSISPPEDLYINDPSLPVGTIKQIDYKAWGAKVIFDYIVTNGDQIVQQKKFISNYKPWQAKFLRGTAPN